MMEPRVSIITIVVEDLDLMAGFYRSMGFKRHRIDDGVAFFQSGGAIFALFPRETAEMDSGIAFGEGPSRVYLAYNTRTEFEVDAVLALAERAGGKIVKQASRAFWGGWYGYFTDPEGNVWEVAHNPDFPLDEAGNISLPE